jgi:hypothetical protein
VRSINWAAGLVAIAVTVQAETLSDNLTKTTAGTESATGNTVLAASFGTGASVDTLDSVTLSLGSGSSGQATAYLYSDGGLKPGNMIGTLAASSGAQGTYSGGGATLSPNTTYWIVLKADAGKLDWSWTTVNAGDGAGFQNTWAISSDAGATWFSFPVYPLQFRVTTGIGSTISANPNPIALAAGQAYGRTTVNWQASGVVRVQVRVGTPDGPALTGIDGAMGSVETGDWVSDGMTFYLQDASSGDSAGAAKTLASVRVSVGASSLKAGTLIASPNPIARSGGQAYGVTTLSWQATGVTQVQLRVGSPDGPPLTGIDAPSGSAQTGEWVSDGMTFYLQDASDGNSTGATKTLATVQVHVQ